MSGCAFLEEVSRQNVLNYELDEEFMQENTVSVEMGEVITLDSKEDNRGEEFMYVASFGWEGVMELQINDAVVYASPQEPGVGESDLFFSWTEATEREADRKFCFVVISLTLNNIDAVLDSGSGEEHFMISILRLLNKTKSNEYIEAAYFDSTTENAGIKDGYRFDIKVGEKKDMKLGYFIYEDELDNEYCYSVGTANIDKYKVEIDLSPMA